MDPELCLDPDSELGKFKAGSRSGINHSGSTTLLIKTIQIWLYAKKQQKILIRAKRLAPDLQLPNGLRF